MELLSLVGMAGDVEGKVGFEIGYIQMDRIQPEAIHKLYYTYNK